MITHLDILTEKLQILLDKPATREEASSGRTNNQVETCAVAKARNLRAVSLLQAETEFAERYENKKRKEEFLASRRLIRHLYPDLPPVLKSQNGAPTFPPTFFGSISHSTASDGTTLVGFTCSRSAPVGIDVQIIRPVSENIISAIAVNDTERSLPPLHLFSAKEAAFKALSAELPFVFYPKRLTLDIIQEDVFVVIGIGDQSNAQKIRNELKTTIVQTRFASDASTWIVSLAVRA